MQIRDTGLRFSPVTIILHWIAAAMVVTLLWFGLTAGRLDVGAEKVKLIWLHSSLGVGIFVISVYRLVARSRFHHPLPIGAISPIEVIMSRAVAMGLIVATVVLPVVGWIAM